MFLQNGNRKNRHENDVNIDKYRHEINFSLLFTLLIFLIISFMKKKPYFGCAYKTPIEKTAELNNLSWNILFFGCSYKTAIEKTPWKWCQYWKISPWNKLFTLLIFLIISFMKKSHISGVPTKRQYWVILPKFTSTKWRVALFSNNFGHETSTEYSIYILIMVHKFSPNYFCKKCFSFLRCPYKTPIEKTAKLNKF